MDSGQFIEARDGTPIFVKRSLPSTHKPTCVFLHGLGEGGYAWDEVCEGVEDLVWSVVIDLRGHGESGHSVTHRYDVQTHVDDVARVIRTLGLRGVIVVGHSLGGRIATELAAGVHSAVAALVLVDSLPELNETAAEGVGERLRESLRVYTSVDEYSQCLMETRPLLEPATAQRLARAALRECPGGVALRIDPFVAEGRHISDENDRARALGMLQSVGCPILVVRGAASALVSAGAAARIVGLLHCARLRTIPGAGHAVMSDNCREFVSALREFVQGIVWPLKSTANGGTYGFDP